MAALLLVLAPLPSACSESGSVVFGATTELNPQLIERVDVTVTLDGAAYEEFSYPRAELGFPMEVRLDELEDGARVGATFSVVSQGSVVLTRVAETDVISGRTLLVPLAFEAACAGSQVPGCPKGETCKAGQCASAYEDPAKLVDYYAGWAGTGGDRCEPGGAPELTVGEGQAAYLPLSEGDTVQVEAGPQGGYHIWIAARARNVKQSGTITEVSGRIDEAGYDVTPFSVVFTLDGDEGGYCRIFGLRFRLDDNTHPIEGLLGKDLDLTIKMTDSDGDVATGQRRVRLSDSVL